VFRAGRAVIVLKLLLRAGRSVLLALFAAVLFIEEWGWRPLTAWAARLAQWPPLARFEARVRLWPAKNALALFMVPAVLMFPVKVFALWLIHLGHTGSGLVVIVGAKVLGTALVGRLFVVTEAQLVQFTWFARGLAWWRTTKQHVKEAVQRTRWWRAARAARRRLALRLRRWLN